MRNVFLFFPLFLLGALNGFAQTNPVALPPHLRNPFFEFRQRRVQDSVSRETAKHALELLHKSCRMELIDSDMMIILHDDSVSFQSTDDELKRIDKDIKPVEEAIKRMIRESKGQLVVWRRDGGPGKVLVEIYHIENERVYFTFETEQLKDSKVCP
jgi:hypothetical protein